MQIRLLQIDISDGTGFLVREPFIQLYFPSSHFLDLFTFSDSFLAFLYVTPFSVNCLNKTKQLKEMKRGFDACQTHRSMYPSIFNRFPVIQPISSKVRHFSTFCTFWPPLGMPLGQSR